MCPRNLNCPPSCNGNIYDCKTAQYYVHQLTEATGIDTKQARALYRAGYKSPLQLVKLSYQQIYLIKGLGPKAILKIMKYIGDNMKREDKQ